MANPNCQGFHHRGPSGYNQGGNFSQGQGWRSHHGNNFNKDQGGPSIRPSNQGPNMYERTTKLEDTLTQFMQVSLSNHKSTEFAIKNLEVQVDQLAKQLVERVRKYDTRYFFADGLKEFRRTHDINDNVIIRFFAPDKNTSFEVDVIGLIHGQSRGRSVVTTRRHIFTIDITQDMVHHNLPLVLPTTTSNFLFGSKKYIPVHRGYDKRNQWQITIHDGLPSLAEPWFQYLSQYNLMPGDEVLFFFRFDEHAWKILFRKEVIWDDTLSS
ncbi:hypothetical protein GmHk_10G028520 [Glycine max]|nr:hypothetical protein GmHk_10G028520 [Glycine max]